MNTYIYDKTDKGREEIATRKYQLPAKLRPLLVMIDGQRPFEVLAKNFAGLGLAEEAIGELLSHEYISLVGGVPAANEPELAPAAPRPPASARARMLARTAARQEKLAAGIDTQLMQDEPDEPAESSASIRALYDFFTQTIKSTMGQDGIELQLKVEESTRIADFRAVRLPYLQAVFAAHGREMVLSLRDRLDMLLGGKPERDDFELTKG